MEPFRQDSKDARSRRSVVFCCLPCSRILTREACRLLQVVKVVQVVFHPQQGLSNAKHSISWHPFSLWHNLCKLSTAHGLSKGFYMIVKVVQVVFPTQQVVLETIPRPSIPRSARRRWLPRRCHPHSLLLLHRGTSRGWRRAARFCCRGGCGQGTTCGSQRQSSRPRW